MVKSVDDLRGAYLGDEQSGGTVGGADGHVRRATLTSKAQPDMAGEGVGVDDEACLGHRSGEHTVEMIAKDAGGCFQAPPGDWHYAAAAKLSAQ
jgi:hypothetical protein